MTSIECMRGGMTRIGVHPIIALSLSILILIILLYLALYLWNNVLIKVCTIVKPVNNISEILGLYVLLQILFGK